MTKRMTRLVVADPSLADARGHHFSLTMQVTRGAQLQGIEVIWFTHKDFVAPDSLDGIGIYSVFSATMYDRYRPEKKADLSADPHRRLLDELERGIELCGLLCDDHIYFHTGFGDLYRALPGYGSTPHWKKKPFLHICTPYDLSTMPGKDPGTALLECFKTIRFMESVDKKLFFWAETPQLALHYTLSYGFNVRAMPLPSPQKIVADAPVAESDVVTAIYLGAAREEKGFLDLPQLVERLYKPYGQTGKLRFVVQCTPQIIGRLPSIKSAIEKLASYPAGYVELIDGVLDEESYHDHLLASDVVLLLYSQKNYGIRGSGIAVEAICAGKSILTYEGTFCASLLTNSACGAVGNVNEAVEKLSEVIEARSEYRQRAAVQGEQYRLANSVERYVARIIGQVEPRYSVPFFPSAIIGYLSPALVKMA